MGAASERIVVQATPREKRAIMAKARKLGMPIAELMRRVPVVYLVFDVLYAGEELLLARPLRERMVVLDELLAAEKVSHHRDTEAQRRTKGFFYILLFLYSVSLCLCGCFQFC